MALKLRQSSMLSAHDCVRQTGEQAQQLLPGVAHCNFNSMLCGLHTAPHDASS